MKLPNREKLEGEYDASFELDTCASTGDSLFDVPQVENTLRNTFDLSGPDSTLGSGKKKERGGIIWRMPDSSYQAFEVTDPTKAISTECNFQFINNQTPPQPGAVSRRAPCILTRLGRL